MTDKKAEQSSPTADALGPAAKSFGNEIEPLGKEAGEVTLRVGRLLLAPLRGSVYGIEQVSEWLWREVSARLKGVSPEKIVDPNPRIAIPATQALIYSMNDEQIREMFANLLATDMNSDTKSLAHPAFVELIREMTPYDAKVLALLQEQPQIEYRVLLRENEGRWVEIGIVHSFETTPQTEDSSELGKYLRTRSRIVVDNLVRLGLAEIRRGDRPGRADEDAMEEIKKSFGGHAEEVKKVLSTGHELHKSVSERGSVFVEPAGIYLTGLGQIFCMAALPKP